MYETLVNELRHYFDTVPLVLEATDAIENLKAEIEKYRHAAFVICEVCVDASKQHITPEAALDKIQRNIYYKRAE